MSDLKLGASTVAIAFTIPPVTPSGEMIHSVRVEGGGRPFTVTGLQSGRAYSLAELYALGREQGAFK